MLVVWREGEMFPVEQRVDEEWAIEPGALKQLRLPTEFTICTRDKFDHWITANGYCIDDVWKRTELRSVLFSRGTSRGRTATRQVWPVRASERLV